MSVEEDMNFSHFEIIKTQNNTDQILLLILQKLEAMEVNYEKSLEKMTTKYISKMTFLETEILRLQMLVRKSLKQNENLKIETSLISESEYQKQDLEDDNELIEATKAIEEEPTVITEEEYANPDTDQYDDIEIATEEYQVANRHFIIKELEEDFVVNESELSSFEKSQAAEKSNKPNEESVIFLVNNKRRKTETKKREDLDCLKMIPVNSARELEELDKLLADNEIEKNGFVDYLNKTKFTSGLKSAFMEIISELVLLEYNYSGKGLVKKALNDYHIFKDYIFDAFCQDSTDFQEREQILQEIKKIIRNSHNNINKYIRNYSKS